MEGNLRRPGLYKSGSYRNEEAAKSLRGFHEQSCNLQKKLKDSTGGPSRDRPQEVLNQYGHIYTNVLFQAYHNQEIGLHKLSKLFNLKKSSYVLEMEGML